MKKYAFILMGENFDPKVHKAMFPTPGMENHIRTVRSQDEARELVKELKEQGFGVIEVCGAFGKKFTKELIELTNNEIGIAYITALPEQEARIGEFFGD